MHACIGGFPEDIILTLLDVFLVFHMFTYITKFVVWIGGRVEFELSSSSIMIGGIQMER